MVPYQIVDGTIVLVFREDGAVRPQTITKSHVSYKPILDELFGECREDVLRGLCDAKESLKAAVAKVYEIDGNVFSVDNDLTVTLNGKQIPRYMAQAITERIQKNCGFDDLSRFTARVMRNPIERVREDLMRFLNHGGFAITASEGKFIAYKGVMATDDPKVFASTHNRNFFYELGTTVYENVPEDSYDVTVACGKGLHVGTYSYAMGYGDTLLEVLVDPAVAICVPNDSNGQKLRCVSLTCVRAIQKGAEAPTTTIRAQDTCVDEISDEADYGNIRSPQEYPAGGLPEPKFKRTYYNKTTGEKVRASSCPGPGWTGKKPLGLV
jgi:hypothetical protein